MKKLRNSRGETMIEVLASILIAALSVTLLFTCVVTSSGLGKDAGDVDTTHYGALSSAEQQAGIGTTGFTVKITGVDGNNNPVTLLNPPSIEIYGGAGMYSYKEKLP